MKEARIPRITRELSDAELGAVTGGLYAYEGQDMRDIPYWQRLKISPAGRLDTSRLDTSGLGTLTTNRP